MAFEAVFTLVAETLVLAKTHGYVEKIENELEEELQLDSDEQTSTSISRWRRNGDKILKSKYMLLTVVILCVTDCALVLGELTLDLHKVKVSLEDTNVLISATEDFLWKIQKAFPSMHRRSPSDIFKMLLSINWTIAWNSNTLEFVNLSTCSIFRNNESWKRNSSNGSTTFLSRSSGIGSKSKFIAKEKSIQEKIAHGFHYCSLTIVGILVIESCPIRLRRQ
ncbi:hypothetical protein CHS0354_020818 [Potamilus streckersoni]|uniref:Uncharacterized protein n=1 Tax=Potamilus streckersoni TaxID=2493646 RepID=A0AAE0RR18_9BIVA|nr:hypothetical protein CHS0354_020818 [Potamilus streckersoni]